jgi:hypothetical protein
MGHLEISSRGIRSFFGSPDVQKLSPYLRSGLLAGTSLVNPGLGALAALGLVGYDVLKKIKNRSKVVGGDGNAIKSLIKEGWNNFNYITFDHLDKKLTNNDRFARVLGSGAGVLLGVATLGIAHLPFNDYLGPVVGKVAETGVRTIVASGFMREMANFGFRQAENRGIENPKDFISQATKSASIVTSALALISMGRSSYDIASSFSGAASEFVNQLISLDAHEEIPWVTPTPTSTSLPEMTETPTPETIEAEPTDATIPNEEQVSLEEVEEYTPQIKERYFHGDRPLMVYEEGLGSVDYNGDQIPDALFDLDEINKFRENGDLPLPRVLIFNGDGVWNAYRPSVDSIAEITPHQIWTLLDSTGEYRVAHIEGLKFDTETKSWEWDQIISEDGTQTYEPDNNGLWVETDVVTTSNDTLTVTADTVDSLDQSTADDVSTDVIDVERDASGRPVYFDDENSAAALVYGPEGGSTGLIQELLAQSHTDWTGNDIGRIGSNLSFELKDLVFQHAGVTPSVRPGDTLESLLARYEVPQTEVDAFIFKVQTASKP